MRLELNTNGAWRVVLRHLQGDALRNAMAAAAELARLSDHGDARRGITWRLVSDADGAIEHQHQLGGESSLCRAQPRQLGERGELRRGQARVLLARRRSSIASRRRTHSHSRHSSQPATPSSHTITAQA